MSLFLSFLNKCFVCACVCVCIEVEADTGLVHG